MDDQSYDRNLTGIWGHVPPVFLFINIKNEAMRKNQWSESQRFESEANISKVRFAKLLC